MFRIVLLNKSGQRSFRFALWAVVPASRQAFYADPVKTSVYKNISPADLAALRAGQIVEEVDTFNGEHLTLAQIRTSLEARWQTFQARITAENAFSHYGASWDGTSWTSGGVN